MSENGGAYVPLVASTATLAETLVAGNTTGGSDIVISNGDAITGETEINLQAGTSGVNGSDVDLVAGAATTGVGGAVVATGGAGGTTGTGGAITMNSGAGGTTSGDSGAVTIRSGAVTSGTAGVVELGVGGASQWRVNANGHFVAVNDDTNDIGSAGSNRPRRIYAGTEVIVGNTVTIGTASVTGSGALTVTATANNLSLLTTAGAGGVGPTVTITASAGAAISTGGDVIFNGGGEEPRAATVARSGSTRAMPPEAGRAVRSSFIPAMASEPIPAEIRSSPAATAGRPALAARSTLRLATEARRAAQAATSAITAGEATSGVGGAVSVFGGVSNGGNGGSVTIQAGNGSVDGGTVTIEGGYNGSGALGRVLIGQDDAATGTIIIGMTGGSQTVTLNNASTITGTTTAALRLTSGTGQRLEMNAAAGQGIWIGNSADQAIQIGASSSFWNPWPQPPAMSIVPGALPAFALAA